MRMASTYCGFDIYIISCNTSACIIRTATYWPQKPISPVTYLLLSSYSDAVRQLKEHCYANINRTYYSRLQVIVSFKKLNINPKQFMFFLKNALKD